jgi:hypothetical protein
MSPSIRDVDNVAIVPFIGLFGGTVLAHFIFNHKTGPEGRERRLKKHKDEKETGNERSAATSRMWTKLLAG